MRVFLLSPYHSGSHAQWAEGYAAHTNHEVHLITMPGSFWQWRLTGGHVTLAEIATARATDVGRPDLILATSLVDVAGLRGLLPAPLRDVPMALYMHENQVTYPALGRNRTERLYGLITWTSLLAADGVAFNSEFHRRSLLEALPGLLGESPDERHLHRIPDVESKSTVLPVGCDLASLQTGPKSDPPLIVWSHRWDPDKDPASFFRILEGIGGVDFEVALLGERFVGQRPEYDDAVAALGSRVIVDGHLEQGAYRDVLARSSIVISTALQEFFGVAIVEAIAAGALPILPDRLVYPERVPPDLREHCLYRSESEAAGLLRTALQDPTSTRQSGRLLRENVMRFDWSEVAPAYDAWLGSIAAS